jgi:hypothetical protein
VVGDPGLFATALIGAGITGAGYSFELAHSRRHSRIKLLSFSKVTPVLNCFPSWFRRLQSHLASAADARSSLNRRIRIGTKRAAINSPLHESSSIKYIRAKSPRNIS